MSNVCEFQNVYKTVSRFPLIQNLSLAVPEGAVFGIIGDYFSGRDCVLKMMAGLSSPTEGTVKPASGNIGAVIGRSGILPHFSVRRQFEIKRLALGLEDPKVVDEMLEAFHLTRVESYTAGKLVTEIQGRLSVALALMGEPEVVILDDPFAAMNRQEIEWLKGLLLEYKEKYHATVIIGTPEAAELTGFATEMVSLGGLSSIRIDPVGNILNASFRENVNANTKETESPVPTSVYSKKQTEPAYLKLTAEPLDEAKKILNSMNIYSYQTKAADVLHIFERYSDLELIRETLAAGGVRVTECRLVFNETEEPGKEG